VTDQNSQASYQESAHEGDSTIRRKVFGFSDLSIFLTGLLNDRDSIASETFDSNFRDPRVGVKTCLIGLPIKLGLESRVFIEN